MEEKSDATSLKQLFQSMVPEGPGILEGIVNKTSPLQISLVNDSMMVLGTESLVIPMHLTDYTTTADISGGSALGNVTGGNHAHGGGVHDGHMNGDGTHAHDGGTHSHQFNTISIKGATITIHNALRQGERVYLLSYNSGKKYFVIDRKG